MLALATMAAGCSLATSFEDYRFVELAAADGAVVADAERPDRQVAPGVDAGDDDDGPMTGADAGLPVEDVGPDVSAQDAGDDTGVDAAPPSEDTGSDASADTAVPDAGPTPIDGGPAPIDGGPAPVDGGSAGCSPVGATCYDGLYCTAMDTCQADGRCSGSPLACDDGIASTTDLCDETLKVCYHL